jgi:3',5'-cyclic AMP phosphodiesterase CpdA
MVKTSPSDQTLRIGLITDIHLGPDRETRCGTHAQRLIEDFLEEMRRFAPAFIVDLGDRIMEVDEPSDRQHTALVRELLGRARVPVHHVLGNHDVAHVSKIDLRGLLDLPTPYRSIDAGGYRCVFLDSTDPVVGEYGGRISDAQLAWLEAELVASQRPAIVFCHHAIDDQPIESNPLFLDHPDWAMVENRIAVRQALMRKGNVAAVVTGHVHWNRIAYMGGIPFLTIQGLVETWTTNGTPAGAYGKLWFGPSGQARLVVEGRDPLVAELKLPCPATSRA